MKALLQGLNPEQLDAVTTIEGPLLVLAGAGTGKTRVITVRMAHMLAGGVDPTSILAMTFTNKAAAEMRARVAKLVGDAPAELLTVGTFHSFCLKLLREHTIEIGFPKGFTICDAADQLTALKGALRELRIPEAAIQPSTLQSRISLLKNRLISPEQYLSQPGDETDELIGRAFRRYQDHLRRSRNLDFDDLLLEALKLLRENDTVREKVQGRFRYLLIDEYQDTNGPQYEIVRLISQPQCNVCVVGDDDQSIYSWRGADVSKILGFERDYPGAKTVRLETNYRSSQEILDAANKIIQNNPSRHDKTLRSHRGRGELLQAVQSQDEVVEAEYVVRDILERTKRKEAAVGDFAILFRTAMQPRNFEAELRARGLPYVLVGGQSFFDRKEIRDVLAFLKLMANPKDEVSLLRIINCPPRGVGKTTIDRALEFATDQGIAVGDAFNRAEEIDGINLKAVDAVQRMRERLKAMALGSTGKDLVPLVEKLLANVAYRDEINRCYPDEKTRDLRWNSAIEVMNMAENYVRRAKQPSLRKFLNEMSLSGNDDRSKEDASKRDAVTLMTLHAAKGLEFPRVYLVGLEEGILPHIRSVQEDGIEEERRLMYVGITRAQEGLTLSYTATRAKRGARVQSHQSRFMYELRGQPPPPDWIPAGTPPHEADRIRKEAALEAKQAARKSKKKSTRRKKKRTTRR